VLLLLIRNSNVAGVIVEYTYCYGKKRTSYQTLASLASDGECEGLLSLTSVDRVIILVIQIAPFRLRHLALTERWQERETRKVRQAVAMPRCVNIYGLSNKIKRHPSFLRSGKLYDTKSMFGQV